LLEQKLPGQDQVVSWVAGILLELGRDGGYRENQQTRNQQTWNQQTWNQQTWNQQTRIITNIIPLF